MKVPGIDPTGEPGLPGVPMIRRLIAVPWGAEVSVVVNANIREIIQNVNLYPYQGLPSVGISKGSSGWGMASDMGISRTASMIISCSGPVETVTTVR